MMKITMPAFSNLAHSFSGTSPVNQIAQNTARAVRKAVTPAGMMTERPFIEPPYISAIDRLHCQSLFVHKSTCSLYSQGWIPFEHPALPGILAPVSSRSLLFRNQSRQLLIRWALLGQSLVRSCGCRGCLRPSLLGPDGPHHPDETPEIQVPDERCREQNDRYGYRHCYYERPIHPICLLSSSPS